MANNPTLLKMPLAADGEKATIPETTGSTTGEFSQQYGFQAINAMPLQAGGIAPKREDMNGVFNLLGGVAYYAQKGWTFHYDASQDYYLGCVVIDPADGTRYECIADMTAGTVAPHEDTNGDHWRRYTLDDKTNITGSNLVHHRDVITTSGTYTAPVTGLYKITVKGGGGGGAAGTSQVSAYSGHGGGEGGTTIAYVRLEIGDSATVIVGAGGAGAPVGGSATAGGDSSVTVNSVTYTGGGASSAGGAGTIYGASGQSGDTNYNSVGGVAVLQGGCGGGAGGGLGSNGAGVNGVNGGGGGGGAGSAGPSATTKYKGGNGGNGYVWFEYYTPGA